MHNHKTNPNLVRGLLRLSALFGFAAIIVFSFWEIYSPAAALSRLSAIARNYPYTERCDDNGNVITTGKPNCVDLGRYRFVYGPVSRAFRRACMGSEGGAEIIILEEGKASRIEISQVEKSLRFRSLNGVSVPCNTAPH